MIQVSILIATCGGRKCSISRLRSLFTNRVASGGHPAYSVKSTDKEVVKMQSTLTTGRKGRKGFTLIELLVVIAIVAVLAAILFPVFAKVRAKAKQSVCLTNTRQISLALQMYVMDYDQTFPTVSVGWRMPGAYLSSRYGIWPSCRNK